MAKAITIKQPYAQLCVLGAKKIETRTFATKYRGELLIHAGQDFNRYLQNLIDRTHFRDVFKFKVLPNELPIGAIIGSVQLVDVQPVEKLKGNISAAERAFGDYTDGRFGWILESPKLFEEPIAIKGQLGIWNFELPLTHLHHLI